MQTLRNKLSTQCTLNVSKASYEAGWKAGKRDAHLSYTRQIKERDVEIERLTTALRKISDTAHNPSETVWVRIEVLKKEAKDALKGTKS